MSSNTPNLGLLKKDPMVDGNETFNIETMLNENWDKIDEAVGRTGGYGVTTQPTANVYEVNLWPAPASLTAGIRATVKVNVASTGAPMLNINSLGAKPVLKTSGSSASFKQDGVYSLVYDGQAFILQGEGGEVGTATAGDVLSGKTFSGEEGLIEGTMPTKGNQFKAGLWSNPDGDAYVDTYVDVDSGYYPPNTKITIQAYDPDLKTENIRYGTDIFGVAGSPAVVNTSDAHLDSQYLLTGYSGYDDGILKRGTMQHLTGIRTATGASKWANGDLAVYPERGYQKGGAGDGEIKVTQTQLRQAEPALVSENIKQGASVFGVIGNFKTLPSLFEVNESLTYYNNNNPIIMTKNLFTLPSLDSLSFISFRSSRTSCSETYSPPIPIVCYLEVLDSTGITYPFITLSFGYSNYYNFRSSGFFIDLKNNFMGLSTYSNIPNSSSNDNGVIEHLSYNRNFTEWRTHRIAKNEPLTLRMRMVCSQGNYHVERSAEFYVSGMFHYM